jgi:hypothetical protein
MNARFAVCAWILCALVALGHAAGASQAEPARKVPAPAATAKAVARPLLEGTVKGPDGKGVEGARVFCRPWGEAFAERPPVEAKTDAGGAFRLGIVRSWEPGTGVVEGVTDARGRARIEGVEDGLVTVSAGAAGSRALKRSVRPGATVSLILRPAASLAGVVTDESGKPVKGAVVRQELEPHFWGGGLAATTDPRGRFEITGVDPGSHTVIAYHPDGNWVSVPVYGRRRPTDSNGVAEVPTPVGNVEVSARNGKRKGRASVPVSEGASVPVELRLTEPDDGTP